MTTVQIRCGCGQVLAEIEATGQQQVLHLGRCEGCRKRKNPSYPVARVRPDGSYDLAMLAEPADFGTLRWPSLGSGVVV
jgi:hypothetical protein